MSLDPTVLPLEYPRRFLSPTADAGDWSQLAPAFRELQTRSLETPAAVERWLLDRSELEAALSEVRTARYIRLTCQIDDPAAEREYLDFIEQVEPRAKTAQNELDRQYVAAPGRAGLPERYAVLDRRILNRVGLFREANLALETEEARLSQRYNKLIGAMMVNFDGREQTLPQMAVYTEHTDRRLRQRAWEASTARRLQDREEVEATFEQLLELRTQIARQAGCADYVEYTFRVKERFDYTSADCQAFQIAVEEQVMPLVRELHARRRQALGVDVLQPWDMNVDPRGRPPLRPFEQVEQMVQGCADIFSRLDSELAGQFEQMRTLNLLDLESRKGKAPGGYQDELAERRLPFIFMNAAGMEDDARTLLHEGGHAFHAFAARSEPLWPYRQPPMEFCEVASMSMELLGGRYMEVFYSPADAARSRQTHLEGTLTFLPWCATIDAFQHWLYSHPGHSAAERQACWLDLHRRFGGLESYAGYEVALSARWQRQLHLFEYPFYYIEYGIAQLGALGLWRLAQADESAALAGYKRALALGGARPLPELFAAAGLRFDFSPAYVGQIVDSLRAALLDRAE